MIPMWLFASLAPRKMSRIRYEITVFTGGIQNARQSYVTERVDREMNVCIFLMFIGAEISESVNINIQVIQFEIIVLR